MKIKIDRKCVCLKGDPAFTKSQGSYQSLKRDIRNEGGGYLLELWATDSDANLAQSGNDKEITTIINEFPEVYAKIKGLPPYRTQDHAIII